MSINISINLEATLICLAIVFTLVASLSCLQFCRLLKSGKVLQLWTTQKGLHLAIGVLCIARAGFLLVGVWSWNANGFLSSRTNETLRSWFYALDLVSEACYFTAVEILALFWAELYFIATNRGRFYMRFMRPLTGVILLAVYGVAVAMWFCVMSIWDNTDVLMTTPYSLVWAGLLLAVAIPFSVFAKGVISELRQVPIELQMRRQKLREVYILTAVVTPCVVVKAAVLVIISNRPLAIDTKAGMTWLALYFLGLELLPLVVALFFHRRRQMQREALFGPETAYLLRPKSSGEGDVEASIRYLSGRDNASSYRNHKEDL